MLAPMLKRSLVLFVALAAVAAQAQQKEIVAAYKAMDVAAAKKDAAGIMKHFDKSCVYIDKGGQKTTFQALDAQLKQQFKFVKSATSKTKLESLKPAGSKAVAVTSQAITIKLANPQTKKDVTFEQRNRSTDTWKKFGNAWRIVEVKVLSESMTMDGKPMPQPGAAPKK